MTSSNLPEGAGPASRPTAEDHAAMATAIAAFWQWWRAVGASAVADALGNDLDSATGALDDKVRALHPALGWELRPGVGAQHALVVSGEGNPPLRARARRWLLAAPPTNAVWEYLDSRAQPEAPGWPTLILGDVELPLAEVQVELERDGTRFDITLFHPELRSLDHEDRNQVVFLALDAALGEDATETWIGVIEASTEAPRAGLSLTELRVAVADLASEFSEPDGTPAGLPPAPMGPADRCW